MKNQRTLRLGTRGSTLARWQAEWVAQQLRAHGHVVELVEITTRGDWEQGSPIGTVGATGVFTKEIQRALLAGEIDLAVHSMKDLPTEPVEGLALAAVPPRESAADALVASVATSVQELPKQARVGTGSLRRQAQLRHVRPDLRVEDIRGNVDTRLRKLGEGQFDAIVLAEAGLRRLGLAERITRVLPFDVMLPAVGQGALAIECRADDDATLAAVKPIEDAKTRMAVTAERALLAHLRGGCMAPVGAWGRVTGGTVQLTAVVLSGDGSRRILSAGSAMLDAAVTLGCAVADQLIAQGADKLIAESRKR